MHFQQGLDWFFSHSACLGDRSLAACVERKFSLLPHRLGRRLVLIWAGIDKLNMNWMDHRKKCSKARTFHCYMQSYEAVETVNSPLTFTLSKGSWRIHLWVYNYDNQIVGRNKLCMYWTFKINFGWEDYLPVVTNRKHRVSLSWLRVSCHTLRGETGRYQRPPIPADQWTCIRTYCKNGIIIIHGGWWSILYNGVQDDTGTFCMNLFPRKTLFSLNTK